MIHEKHKTMLYTDKGVRKGIANVILGHLRIRQAKEK